ncbi:hypothetical protein CsSME_00044629 [Camellia sinensis var. sinensis]
MSMIYVYLFVKNLLLPFAKFRESEEPSKENEKNVDAEKQLGQEDTADANKENPVNDPKEKEKEKEPEPEDKVSILFENVRYPCLNSHRCSQFSCD